MADRLVHVVGTAAGGVGSAALVALAAGNAGGATLAASVIYAVGLILMLGCSAANNVIVGSPRAWLLRRLDHAAIFVMIAGTYTPFTACRLHGGWAFGMTAAVWAGALAGVFLKLARPHHLERLSVAAYLALGWIVVVGARPVLAALDYSTLMLLAAGGALYCIGICFHLWRSLPFHNAIWHAFVLVAAVCHYAAVLNGVVLAA